MVSRAGHAAPSGAISLQLTPSDALAPAARAALDELRRRAILDTPSVIYSTDQKQRWLDAAEATVALRSELTFLAFARRGASAQLAGFAELDLEAGELVALFVRPSHARRGVGRLLFQAVEAVARRAHLPRITVTAALDALGFYTRVGFEQHLVGHARSEVGARLPAALLSKPVAGGFSVELSADAS